MSYTETQLGRSTVGNLPGIKNFFFSLKKNIYEKEKGFCYWVFYEMVSICFIFQLQLL